MTKKKPTVFRDIVNSIGRFRSKIVKGVTRLFRGRAVTEQVPMVAQSLAGNSLDNDDPYLEYNAKVSELNDVVVELGLHKRISASHQYMYEMGRRDGSLGVFLDNLVDIARATAQEMFRHVYVIVKGSLAGVSADKETRQNIMEYDKLCYERDRAYDDYVQYQYRFFPRNYSWFLFVLYLIIGLALIMADMPLALRLVQEGFNLETSGNASEGLPYLFIGNFWRIVALNWETFATASGISLCTVYIKIYYDDFIGTPYANSVMTFRRFAQENNFDDAIANNEKLQTDIKREYKAKRRWKTAFAILTLLAIVLLAFFRLETGVKNKTFDLSFFSGAAFIAITILFPIIGGICLSQALTNFQNRVRLWQSGRKCIKSRTQYLCSSAIYTTIQKRYEDLFAASHRLCDEGLMVEEYLDCLMAFYRRGFSTGGMQPEKYNRGEDFYSKIWEWRNLAISRKINHNISKLN